MPSKDAARPYLRVRGVEDGDLWTVPPGSALWQQLLIAQGAGVGELCATLPAIRSGTVPGALGPLQEALRLLVQQYLESPPAARYELVHGVYRMGQWVRALTLVKDITDD